MAIAKRRATEAEVAAKLGISLATVNRMKNGHYVPDVNQITALADLCAVTDDFLLRGVYNEQDAA